MKMPASRTWIPSLFVTLAWLPGSLAQTDSDFPQNSAPAAEVATPAPTTTDSTNIRFSHWTGEIVKLSQARIEQNILLMFMYKAGAFKLDPDQIIQLKDLGVPASIITAMLQHDQRLDAATKLLMVTTQPAQQTASSPAPSDSAAAVLPDGLNERSPAEVYQTLPDIQLAELQQPLTQQHDSSSFPFPDQANLFPEKKRSLYPVREPYPVELTAPIVFVHAAEITPNTLVIVGFPPTTR